MFHDLDPQWSKPKMEKVHRAVVGIDPGLDGGVTIFDNELHTVPMPTRAGPKGGREVDAKQLHNMLKIDNTNKSFPSWIMALAVVESVHSMPRQGVRSVFTFGQAQRVITPISI